MSMKFFVSCAKGLEYLLADELVALGAAKATATIAGVNAEGTLADAQRAVLWSRLASRVLWPLAGFDCPDEQALYAGAADLVFEPAGLDKDTAAARLTERLHAAWRPAAAPATPESK